MIPPDQLTEAPRKMDLRPYLDRSNPVQKSLFERGIALVQGAKLWYQPFILADGVEVGEGQNLEERYRNCQSLFDNNVYLSDEFRHYWTGNSRKLASDGRFFADCNSRYRRGYQLIADTIERGMGGISGLSVMELGCNTGLSLFNLATRGASACTGVDWTDHSEAIDWLNAVLGTNVRYLNGRYDNLLHTVSGVDVPDADVVINTIFLNHQGDPVQALCYLADHARKAILLWVLLYDDADVLSVRYGRVSGIHDLGAGRPLPLSFHNDISMSVALFRTCLEQLGFGQIEFVDPGQYNILPEGFRMVLARRTDDRKSAYHAMRSG